MLDDSRRESMEARAHLGATIRAPQAAHLQIRILQMDNIDDVR